MAESKVSKIARVCQIEGCNGKHKGHGYCNKHFQQFKKYGYIPEEKPELKCWVCGDKHHAQGLCSKHYRQVQRHGKLLTRTIYDPNEFIVKGDVCGIQLYDVKGNWVAEALIDTADLPLVCNYKWYLYRGKRYNYVASKTEGFQLYLHRVIMNPEKGQNVDHRNHDTLKNLRSNLRVCTRSQNQYNSKMPITNTSGAKCVSWDKIHKLWVVRIKKDKVVHEIGYFKSFTEAETAATEARSKLHGNFAHNG